MRVLIIGYGKMGQLHSQTLNSLGVECNSYDLQENIPNLEQFTHIIVATPILDHYQTYKKLCNFPGRILIEKPVIVNSQQLFVLNDHRIFAGLSERFNPCVIEFCDRKLENFCNFKFTRIVSELKENLFLDLAIHDLDLLGIFLKSPDVIVKDFLTKSSKEYYLNLKANDINCSFTWKIGSRERKVEIQTDKESYCLDLLNQKINNSYFEGQALINELTSFLRGEECNGYYSHRLLTKIVE